MAIGFIKMFCHFLSLERKKVTKESSSTDDITAHPCTRLDEAEVVSFLRLLNLDPQAQSALSTFNS